jgi:L-malate glycosyltransferase
MNVLNRWKYNHPQIKAIVAVSERVKHILSPLIKDKGRLKVMYDAVDIARFRIISNRHLLEHEFPACEGKHKVGCIAALVDHKDIPTYIRMVHYVVQVLNRKDFHFFIIGGGDLEKDIRAMIMEYRLENYITLTGRREDIPQVLQSLDYYVFTSKMEGFGSTILEVMAAGVPVIATKVGAAAEMLEHRKNAMLANIGDEVGLGNALLDLVNNDHLSHHLVQHALADVAAYSLENYTGSMVLLYERTMSRKG